jgi:hypothetical protein
VIYDVVPTVAVGATDNVRVAADSATGGVSNPREASGFTTINFDAGLRYQAARSTHAINYRLAWTRFFADESADSLSNGLVASSSFNLSARLTLRFAATGAISRTSAVGFGNPAMVVPTGVAANPNLFVATSVLQALSYQPNPRRSYAQTLSFAQLQYLAAATPLPDTKVVSGSFRANQIVGRQTFFLDSRLSYSAATNPALGAGAFSDGNVFLAQLAVGWHDDLSRAWSSDLQGGPVAMFKLDGPFVLAPGGIAALNYVDRYWFASVTASQLPAPNLYLGEATITDQLFVRLALPLGRSEVYYVTGFGGYIYARIADAQVALTRAYDQLTAGAALAATARLHPVGASLSYTALSQRGSSSPSGEIPDLARQIVMLNVFGTFTFGRGTPPIFGLM